MQRFDSDTMMLTDNEILVQAAEKNYAVFKTPTSLVTANKTKRYYTPEQQADLDIKTSVNKIGEIVNLSQVLNSIYWDNIHKGKSHEDLLPLYCDIVTLDILSGIEIDKAKKEFEVNSTKELRRMKEKYADELRTSDGRKKLPHFFAHIDRLKKYYNTERRCYVKYETTMDYVQTVINGFKIKKKQHTETLPLSSILNEFRVDTRYIDYRQISYIYDLVTAYVVDRNRIYSSLDDSDSKREMNNYYKEVLINTIAELKITYNTLYKILKELDDHPNNVKRIILQLMFEKNILSFNRALAMSAESIECIEMGGEDLYLYGIGFTKTLTECSISSKLTEEIVGA